MSLVTDEATELAALSDMLLERQGGGSGTSYVAEAFEAEAWSTEFFFLLAQVLKRADNLKDQIRSIGGEPNWTARAIGHVDEWQNGFRPNRLEDNWHNVTSTRTALQKASHFEMLSVSVRRIAPIPRLSDEDRSRLIKITIELLQKLDELQRDDANFLRQVLIEGLEQLQYRLNKLRWLGWGYTQEAIDRILLLHRELTIVTPKEARPADMEAAFYSFRTTVLGILDRVKTASDRYEAALLPIKLASHGYTAYALTAPLLGLTKL